MKIKLFIISFFISCSIVDIFAQDSNIKAEICILPTLNLINKPWIISESKLIDFNNKGLLLKYRLTPKIFITSGFLYETSSGVALIEGRSFNHSYSIFYKNTYYSSYVNFPIWVDYNIYSFSKFNIFTSLGIYKYGWYNSYTEHEYYVSWDPNFYGNEIKNDKGFSYDDFDINLLIKLDYSINKHFGVIIFPLIGYNNIYDGISKYGLKFNLGFGVSIK